ncbi:glycosyltransferase [Georgenia sp. Z1344]|uniref:glycosyltransferase n=1 Tax=Georgenia sp. Z1344 TaxID=3416706 RepID=UPI003CF041B2
MRVVVVTTWFPTALAPSSGSFVVRDALAMASRGDTVDVVHLVPGHQDDGTRHVYHEGLKVLRLPMTPSRPDQIAQVAAALPGILDGADVVHTTAISALLPFVVGRPDAPWVHTEHYSGLTSPENLGFGTRAVLPLVRRLLDRPDVVTAVCEFLADPIREVRGDRATAVVPCIVPPLATVPARPEPSGELRMVSVGGLVERKDPLLAVDVVAELGRRGHPAHLTLVGDGPLASAVRDRADEVGVGERIHLTGTLDRDGVLGELARADLFLGPTRGDNFFVSCAEALVAGRPVVVGSTGGQGEYVDPRVGTLVDVQDAGAYADAVLDLHERTATLSAEDVAATIGDAFSVETVAAGYADAHALAAHVHGSVR